jgi:uncharacterized protein (TIGR03437 family)
VSCAPARLHRAGVSLAVVLSAACAPSTDLQVSSVEPASAAPGELVALTGSGFCGDRAVSPDGLCPTVTGYVDIGINPPMRRADVVEWTGERIAISVPSMAPAGGSSLVVTVDGRSSNAVRFEVR